MNKFLTIELGSNVAFYNNAGRQFFTENGKGYSRKMFYTNPNAQGVVVRIKGHNANACRVFLDNGMEIEMGLSTHYHLNGEVGSCLHHQDTYSLN
jgi:hypothetical protein